MTAPDARQNDELREALARHLADEDAATRGALPYADTSWACVRDRWLPKADALLPVVTAWAEEQARARAAGELQAAAAEIDGDGQGGFPGALRLIGSTDILRTRADVLGADNRTDPA